MTKEELQSLVRGGVLLAPMAGVTDSPFRKICVLNGADGTVSEMISARAVTLGDRTSLDIAARKTTPGAYGIQLFVADGATAAEAVKLLENADLKQDWFDINCGCPAPKIVSSGCGSALMKTPRLIGEIVAAAVKSADCPVTVKIRAGWDEQNKTAVEAAKYAEAAGAAAVTVHGRTRERMYAPPVDREIIAAVKAAVNIPVIANGDIFTPEDAALMKEETCCDGLMIGRGALGRPWIFNAVKSKTPFAEPSPKEKTEYMLRHIGELCELEGERGAMLKARKHAAWYTKGIRNSAAFRREMNGITCYSELLLLAEKIAAAENSEGGFIPPEAGNFCK